MNHKSKDLSIWLHKIKKNFIVTKDTIYMTEKMLKIFNI